MKNEEFVALRQKPTRTGHNFSFFISHFSFLVVPLQRNIIINPQLSIFN